MTDVFCEQKYSGNRLVTLFDASSLADVEMQAIAGETNFAETTFVLSDQPADGGYDVRIFTPRQELQFAGHPTLGTAYLVQRHLIGRPVAQIRLDLGIGQIPVTVADDGTLWMEQLRSARA